MTLRANRACLVCLWNGRERGEVGLGPSPCCPFRSLSYPPLLVRTIRISKKSPSPSIGCVIACLHVAAHTIKNIIGQAQNASNAQEEVDPQPPVNSARRCFLLLTNFRGQCADTPDREYPARFILLSKTNLTFCPWTHLRPCLRRAGCGSHELRRPHPSLSFPCPL